MAMSQDAKQRIPLSRERVLEAAIRLADEGGLESLTMRKLATELGVEAMSLYHHVANKAEVVGGIVDRVVGEFELPSDQRDWEQTVRICAVSAHEALLRHPWACNPVLTPSGSVTTHTARMRYMEWLLRQLRDAGFSADLTYKGYHALDSHIFGFTLWQVGHEVATQDMPDLADNVLDALPADAFPYLIEHIHQHLEAPSGDGARAFEFGLDLILEGLKRARSRV
jgi:AcrR family transcriptional regulator